MDRYSYADGELPRSVTRHLSPEDVPEDLVWDLVNTCAVRAECDACGHEAIYLDWPNSMDQPECRDPECDEQLLFPS